jgi:hypothetical protein
VQPIAYAGVPTVSAWPFRGKIKTHLSPSPFGGQPRKMSGGASSRPSPAAPARARRRRRPQPTAAAHRRSALHGVVRHYVAWTAG